MVDLTELDGVGPARSGYLEEAGYDDFQNIADADPEKLAEEVEMPEDTALELVVQSQNIVAEDESDGVTESEPDSITQEVEESLEAQVEEEADEVEEELEEPDVEESEVEPSEDPVDAGPEEYEFTISFESGLQYDTFFDSVMAQRSKMLRSNRDGVDAFDHALEQMRQGSDEVTLQMTEAQLNDLHNCVRQKTVDYKGDNLIEHMDELKQVLNQVNEARNEYLF
jgi:hypothetical protein